jgi:membrane associated rhomboid family serine protease
MAWWEGIARALGLNPVQLRWKLHRLQDRAHKQRAASENRLRAVTYGHKVCPGCGLTVDRGARRCPRCARRLPSLALVRLGRVARIFVPAGAYTYTGVFVALNVAFYLAMLLRSGGGPAALGQGIDPRVIARFGAGDSIAIAHGEAWRLVTAIFLHFNLLHLIFNCLALIQIGPLIEELVGRRRYLPLYLASGVCGALASAAGGWITGPRLSAGASGVVFGLIAAGLVYGYVRRLGSSAGFRQGLAKWALIGGIMSFLPGIDLLAHAGGGLAGASLALAIEPRRPAHRAWALGEATGLLLITGSIAAAWFFGAPLQALGR